MQNESETQLIACAHCSGKGTCLIENNSSCGSCLKEAKLKSESKIVVCSVCSGGGSATVASKILKNKVTILIVVIVLVTFLLYAGQNLSANNNFDKIFPVVGSLTTMIVTFYFTQGK
ncbi:MAG: hypothetical protein Q7S42_05840 [Candidatus Omnitrophota bacterium]|nr:hypothetical protein [Candidatus Omnitrophota bacterium]